MNHDEDLEKLKNLVCKDCERTLACNSLKMRFGCAVDERGTAYIWIDPPWIFVKDNNIITNSDESPYDTYEFQEWCELLNPLNKTQLVSFDYLDNGNFALHFSENYSLLMPYSPNEEDDDEDYEHWYIYQK